MAPHLHIPRLMKGVERHHTASAERGVLNLATAINLRGGVFVKEYTGTRYPGCNNVKSYTNLKGGTAASLGGEEYKEFLEDAWKFYEQQPGSRHHMPSLTLVHDRSRVHTSKVVQQWLQQQKIRAMLAPPRSPDLMPLDYGFFGTVKQKLSRALLPTAAWEARAKKFLQLIQEEPCAAAIRAFRSRLEDCLQAKGGHFEEARRCLKKCRSENAAT